MGHFELIKKQICERKSLDKEKRRAEEEGSSLQHSKSIKIEADGNPSASGTLDKVETVMENEQELKTKVEEEKDVTNVSNNGWLIKKKNAYGSGRKSEDKSVKDFKEEKNDLTSSQSESV